MKIKDANLINNITGSEKIPVSAGTDTPATVSLDQIKDYAQVTPDWNANSGEAGYIENRTHYKYFYQQYNKICSQFIHWQDEDWSEWVSYTISGPKLNLAYCIEDSYGSSSEYIAINPSESIQLSESELTWYDNEYGDLYANVSVEYYAEYYDDWYDYGYTYYFRWKKVGDGGTINIKQLITKEGTAPLSDEYLSDNIVKAPQIENMAFKSDIPELCPGAKILYNFGYVWWETHSATISKANQPLMIDGVLRIPKWDYNSDYDGFGTIETDSYTVTVKHTKINDEYLYEVTFTKGGGLHKVAIVSINTLDVKLLPNTVALKSDILFGTPGYSFVYTFKNSYRRDGDVLTTRIDYNKLIEYLYINNKIYKLEWNDYSCCDIVINDMSLHCEYEHQYSDTIGEGYMYTITITGSGWLEISLIKVTPVDEMLLPSFNYDFKLGSGNIIIKNKPGLNLENSTSTYLRKTLSGTIPFSHSDHIYIKLESNEKIIPIDFYDPVEESFDYVGKQINCSFTVTSNNSGTYDLNYNFTTDSIYIINITIGCGTFIKLSEDIIPDTIARSSEITSLQDKILELTRKIEALENN